MINGDRVAKHRAKIYYVSQWGIYWPWYWSCWNQGSRVWNKLLVTKEDIENESEDHSFLLESRLSMDDIYQRQQGLLTSFPTLLLTFCCIHLASQTPSPHIFCSLGSITPCYTFVTRDNGRFCPKPPIPVVSILEGHGIGLCHAAQSLLGETRSCRTHPEPRQWTGVSKGVA